MTRELTLDELLASPLVRQVMACDRVEEHQVRALATRVRAELEARSTPHRPDEPCSFMA